MFEEVEIYTKFVLAQGLLYYVLHDSVGVRELLTHHINEPNRKLIWHILPVFVLTK